MLTSTSSTKRAPVKVTIGELFLAKATRAYPAWRRAEDAARCMKGEVVITPTAKLVRAIFRISNLLEQLRVRPCDDGLFPGRAQSWRLENWRTWTRSR